MSRRPAIMATRTSRRLEVHGVVQGVGFRPYVVRLARTLGLDGTVQNAGGHVVIEASGSAEALVDLARRLPAEAPPHSVVSRLVVTELDRGFPPPGHGFHVTESVSLGGVHEIPPDLATCDACLRELFDPRDRRYRYPFVNCTACGPRATIIAELPYDRRRTTMDSFALCPACAAEYADPADRRFHAEPVACPACGPRLGWIPAGAEAPSLHGEDALVAAETMIASGAIVAVKGLGGYQLVCDATMEPAVARLRERKSRPAKPFAVMVRDLGRAREIASIDAAEAALLTSAAAPIVLATTHPGGTALAGSVHPGNDQAGLFLPYTPLHHLLLHDLDRPLVVTSGNRSDEPIAVDDADALDRLTDQADGFLVHDRRIRARYDDSVTRVLGGRPAVVRRARGFAPASLRLPVPSPRPLVAVGAQLKHTFTLADGDRAVPSPHLGDLADQSTFCAFEQELTRLSHLVDIDPEVIAHDLHPAYLSTQYATDWPADQRLAVQHHHAHVVSCAAEHGLAEPFLGVAYDGLGWGDDATLWGGELFVADLRGYRRVGRFGRAPLPGGEAAVRRPARMALGYLFGGERLGGPPVDAELVGNFARRLPPLEVQTVRRMVGRAVNSPVASSAGRLFDAAASILGLRDDASYEGEAAVSLETAAAGSRAGELPWRLTYAGGLLVYDPAPTLTSLLAGRFDGVPVALLAAAFHGTVTAVTVAMCAEAANRTGLRTVCLSGGVFQNRVLATSIAAALRAHDFTVHLNERVPANDGGVSYGQAAVAAARMRGE